MRKDAEAHAAEDKKARELAEVRNEAEAAVYTAEKMLSDSPSISEDVKKIVTEAIAEVNDAKAGDSIEKIRSSVSALYTATAKITESKNTSTPSEGTQTSSQDDSTTDAQFTEKK
jgi:molecular chaperone DnaK